MRFITITIATAMVWLLALTTPASANAATRLGTNRFVPGTAHAPAPSAGKKSAAAAAAAPQTRARLVVHVVGTNGRPVAGARVLIRHPHRRAPRYHLRSGANGFTGAHVGPGRWVIRARRPGEGRGRAHVVVRGGAPAEVTITLRGARDSFHPHQQHLLGTRLPTLHGTATAAKPDHAKPPAGVGRPPAVAVPTAPPKARPPAQKVPHAANEATH
jgi:hypothetical protein